MLKLKDKQLKSFIKGYNEAVAKKPLTYYSQRIDDRLVFMTVQDGEFVGAATEVSKDRRNGECLCHFCRRFRRGDDIVFVTNTARTAKGEYSSIGQTICSDYESCNRELEDKPPVVKFLRYHIDKGGMMMSDLQARLVDLPTSVKGFCYHDDDGEPYIILNSRLSYEQNKITYLHERKHIEAGEMYDPDYDEYGSYTK